jgi:hypothetical protein
MKNKFNPLALGIAAAIISAGLMFLLGILGNLGVYVNAANMMMQWHMFFSLTPIGIVGGMIEAAVIGFILAYAFAWVYNIFA